MHNVKFGLFYLSTTGGQCLASYYHDSYRNWPIVVCAKTRLHTCTNTDCNDTNDIELPAPECLFAHTNYLISASATDFSEKH